MYKYDGLQCVRNLSSTQNITVAQIFKLFYSFELIIILIGLVLVIALFHNKKGWVDPRISIKNRRISWLGISVPFAIFIIIISVIGLILWLNIKGSDKYSSIILMLTLIILTFYTYYTLQMVKFIAMGPALLTVQVQHTRVLKKFLSLWLQTIKCPNRAQWNPVIEKEDRSAEMYRTIDDGWEYKDFINYHLPSEYANLEKEWNQFREMNNILDSLSHEFYKIIEKDVHEKVGSLDIKPDQRNISNFIKTLYRMCFEYKRDTSKVRQFELIRFGQGSKENFLLRGLDYDFATGTEDQMILAKNELNKFISRVNLFEKYESNLNKIISSEAELNEVRENLIKKLNELIQWTLFPGTECIRLKDFAVSRYK